MIAFLFALLSKDSMAPLVATGAVPDKARLNCLKAEMLNA